MNLPFTREQLYPSHVQEIRREEFMAYLQRATEIVATWPEWKQSILGRKRA